eukprot:TRINITY_DN284_c1_g5_i1.p1 TRINITY_DN284_c1_g5~~TRINITY_DN284_c1_g5_i1.p1  ORF type:complete len:112 (-),score=11.55 TRINITY_DN284_c1_g5_i1:346-681(-)
MSHHGTDSAVTRAYRERFMQIWVKNPTAGPPAVTFLAGCICVLYITYHHFRHNNTIVVNKSNPRQTLSKESTRIVKSETVHKFSMFSQSLDDNKEFKDWVPYKNAWRSKEY